MVGVGGYTVIALHRVFVNHREFLGYAWPMFILAGGVAGALSGALLGRLSIGLRNIYLLISTLAFQIIFVWSIQVSPFFNFGEGMSIGGVSWFGGMVSRDQHSQFWYFVTLTLLMVCILIIKNILRTRHGRMIIAVRKSSCGRLDGNITRIN